jgi:hypothetical protein
MTPRVTTSEPECSRTSGRQNAPSLPSPTLTGDEFYRFLVRSAAQALGARYALLGELVGDHVRSLAFWEGTTFGQEVVYPLAGGPCGVVTTSGARIWTEGLPGAFPDCVVLQSLRAESYAGVPVLSRAGVPIGVRLAFQGGWRAGSRMTSTTP